MRQPLVAGNWKMHGSRASVGTLLGALLASDLADNVEVAVCPTYVHLAQALELCTAGAIGVGAQDCSHADTGAYTGEVAAAMLADLGCDWVILGHSERRAYHGEGDSLIAAKLAAAVAAGLKPILCVGETREQREAGEAQAVVAAQLAGALGDHPGPQGLVVAYEPVWAIGTGLTATPDQAQEVHAFIRAELANVAAVSADDTRILYGGSVKPGNAGDLFAQADIDGALVGGAALVAEDFQAICNAAA
ncbi:triose-phosphate isomerase [Seongchinamella sediminis]|uniref:Triosephosphate isomerase n=1 Tax=Seongchinamella sediminis TaxID=2283635 RepID=A0A3L7DWK2_9GAMM|nr:triose-phosphate isomerase [Seongchinamella sediminis]RLQ20613.1 triose-phosphate isomerase [Seongchinamella sediminis]